MYWNCWKENINNRINHIRIYDKNLNLVSDEVIKESKYSIFEKQHLSNTGDYFNAEPLIEIDSNIKKKSRKENNWIPYHISFA